jgi:VWFA-related protein
MKIALGILSLVIASSAWAQQDPTISVKVNVVSLLATVHDRDGPVVKGLTKDDFVLLEDGVPQKIEYFSQETDLPLTLGLLVDTRRSQTGVLGQERRVSYTFLDQVLREDQDRAFVVAFDKGPDATRSNFLAQGLGSGTRPAENSRRVRHPHV